MASTAWAGDKPQSQGGGGVTTQGICMDCDPGGDPPLPANDASFVSQSVPTSMVAGQVYAVSVQMNNAGSSTWSAAAGYKLGSQNPQDNTTWGLNRVNVAGSIATGQTATFSFSVTAPATPGTYNFQWKMLTGTTWFGAASNNVGITVAAASGTLSASPSPCTFATGATTCTSSITWSSNAANAEIWVSGIDGSNPALFARAQSGTQSATWIQASGARFQLKSGSIVLATKDVYGVPPANVAPSVTLTAPSSGQAFVSGASINLAATASDSDGSVQRVEFWIDGAKIGEDTTSPYAYSWTGTNGNHSVSAKAFDNVGASTSSGPVNFAVNAPPSPPVNATLTRYYVYDANQQLCKTIEPETGATVMHYDAAGNLDWSAAGLPLTGADHFASTASCDTDRAYASGRRVDRTYDARNRPKSLVFPDHNGDQTWEYTPDGLPSRVTTNNNSNLVTNVYNYNRRRMLEDEGMQQATLANWVLDYQYDPNGNLATVRQPGGEVIDYAPNALGQQTQVVGTYGTYATGVSYYPNGAIAQFTYGNGIVHTLTQNARQLPDRSRDAYGISSAPVLDDSYTYDFNGNVAAISDGVTGNGNRTMTYDGLDRLKTVVSPMFGSTGASYKYDVLDNLIELKGPAGQNRQYYYWYEPGTNRLVNIQNELGATVVGLGYDVQGNLENKNGTHFVFDYGNRLRQATYANNDVETYRYDAYGRRTYAATPNTPSGIIYSQYDQAGVLRYQRNDRKHTVLNYVYLGGSLVAIRETPINTSNHVITYQHTDALGTPVAVTDANRNVIDRNQYEPYGQLLNEPITDGVGFTGHVMDAQTKLTYMQQRYYDPMIGRFLSVDPVTVTSVGGNFNRYWYANNNPYRFADPDGRQSKSSSRAPENCAEGTTCVEPPPPPPRGCGDTRECWYDGTWHTSPAPNSFKEKLDQWVAAHPAPQWAVDGSAGTANGILTVTTLGTVSQGSAWNALGINGGVNQNSGAYTAGTYSGYIIGAGTLWAAGLNGGANSVFWSGSGNMARAARLGTSLERTPIGAFLNMLGSRTPDWLWRVASATFAANARGTALKVGVVEGRIWLSIEKVILEWRGVPFRVVP